MDEGPGGERQPAQRRERWESASSTVLTTLGVGFIVVYSVYVLAQDLPGPVEQVLSVFLIVVWASFFVDVVVRIVLTPRGGRLRWAFRHPVDVLSAVLPVFRAFRVVVLLEQVQYFRHRSRDAVRARFLTQALSYALVFISFIAMATLQVERDAPGSTITTFGDAMWWAVVTLATVGYGDTYPVTTLGRIYAVTLMIGGIAIVGVASATVVSVLNERLSAVERSRREEAAPSDDPDAAPATIQDVPSFDAASVLVDDVDEPAGPDDARGGASG